MEMEIESSKRLAIPTSNGTGIELEQTQNIDVIKNRVSVSKEVSVVSKESTSRDCIEIINHEIDKELSIYLTHEAEMIRQKNNGQVEKFFKTLDTELSRPMTDHIHQRSLQMNMAKPTLKTNILQFMFIVIGGCMTYVKAIEYLEPPNYSEMDKCKNPNWFQSYVYHSGCGGFGIMDAAGSAVGTVLTTSADIGNVFLPVIVSITIIITINLFMSLNKDYQKYNIAKIDYKNGFTKITKQNITTYRTNLVGAIQIIAQNKSALSKLISEKMRREYFSLEKIDNRNLIYENISISLISQILNLIDTTSKQGIFATDEEHKSISEKSWKLDQVVANCGVECQQMIGQYKSQAIGGIVSSGSLAKGAFSTITGFGTKIISGGLI